MKPVALLSLLATAALLHCAPAHAKDAMNAILSDDAKSLAYSPCAVDEGAECISHDINCRGDSGFGSGMAMVVFGSGEEPNVRALAKTLIDKPFGEAKVGFDAGGSRVDVTVAAITVSKDEMNGDWVLALHFDDGDLFLQSLSAATAKDAKADVAGYTVVLSQDAGTAKKLLKLRQACSGEAQ